MSRLHKLFRQEERKTITDGEVAIEVIFRSLTSHEESAVRDFARRKRADITKAYDTPEQRESLMTVRRGQTTEEIIDSIVGADLGTAESVADLAPNGGDPHEEDRAAKEREALQRAAAHRRTMLVSLSREDLVKQAVDRDVAGTIGGEVNLAVLDYSLCLMTLDADTRAPMLSLDAESEDWIGGVSGAIKLSLTNAWTEMQMARTQKQLRIVVENPTSSPPGVSARSQDGSPGATTLISSISPTP